MERLCDVTIEVGGYQKNREKEIKRVCMVEWMFREDDFRHKPADDGKHVLLEASGFGYLYEGESKEEVVTRLENAVWRANGAMCHVNVTAKRIKDGRYETAGIEEIDVDAA